jgi:hypothetical protein
VMLYHGCYCPTPRKGKISRNGGVAHPVRK